MASGRFGGLEKPVKRKERAESVRVLFLGGTASEAANLPRAIERITREHGHKLADAAICLPILGRSVVSPLAAKGSELLSRTA